MSLGYFSGGLDSSLIASIASKVSNKKINTYTIGFTDKKYDESIYSSVPNILKAIG